MSYFNQKEYINPVIHSLSSHHRTFIKKHSELIDAEVLCSWFLAHAVGSIKIALEELEDEFIPNELEAMIQYTINSDCTMAEPPEAGDLARLFTKDKTLAAQVKAMTRDKLAALALLAQERLAGDGTDERFLSPLELGRALNPPRSRSRILILCREGRIQGAIKHPSSGQWKIPFRLLGAIEEALNESRAKKGHCIGEKRNRRARKR